MVNGGYVMPEYINAMQEREKFLPHTSEMALLFLTEEVLQKFDFEKRNLNNPVSARSQV